MKTIASTLAFGVFMTGRILSSSALRIDPNTPPTQADLLQAQAHWQYFGFEDYDFQYVRADGAADIEAACAWTILVREGYLDTTLDCNGDEIFTSPPPPTVDGLFSLIQDAIDQKAHNITVEYNDFYGYPQAIVIDYSKDVSGDQVQIQVPLFFSKFSEDKLSGDNLDTARERLNQARQEWHGIEGVSRDYYFDLDMSCQICADKHFPWHVSVSYEIVVGAVDSTGASVASEDLIAFATTIEELFVTIEDAITFFADEIHVEYDETWGYPTKVFINQDNTVSDAQYDVTISSLDFMN